MMHFFTLKKYYFFEIILNSGCQSTIQEEVYAKPKQIIKLFKAYGY